MASSGHWPSEISLLTDTMTNSSRTKHTDTDSLITESHTSHVSPPGETPKPQVPKEMSRRMRLLAQRKKDNSSASSKRRGELLLEEKEKERKSEYVAAQLSVRLQILEMFIDKSLVDERFLGQKEINPWKFRRNKRLENKWEFVNNVLTTQEMIASIRDAKQRQRQLEAAHSDSGRGESSPDQHQDAEPSNVHSGAPQKQNALDVQEDTGNNRHIGKTILHTDGRLTQGKRTKFVREDPFVEVPNAEKSDRNDTVCENSRSNENEISNGSNSHTPNRVLPLRSPLPKTELYTSSITKTQKPQQKKISFKTTRRTQIKSLESPKLKVRQRMPKKPPKSNGVKVAFGTHYYVDTCLFCGNRLCAGLSAQKRALDCPGHVSSSDLMQARMADIAGIYREATLSWKKRFQENIILRMKQIEESMNEKLLSHKWSEVNR